MMPATQAPQNIKMAVYKCIAYIRWQASMSFHMGKVHMDILQQAVYKGLMHTIWDGGEYASLDGLLQGMTSYRPDICFQ